MPTVAIAPGEDSTTLTGQPRQTARDVVDTVKKNSTLVGLVQPAAIVVGLASHPGQTVAGLGSIASAALHGNVAALGHQASTFINNAVRPGGIAGTINGSSMGLQAGVNGLVGSLEIYEGVKGRDKYLGYIGGADLLSCAANVTQMCGAGLPAVGLALTSSAIKVGLVVRYPHDYSRVQKAKVLFDAAGSISSAVLRSGIAPLPGAIGNALFGPSELLYMNNAKVRATVDKGLDWIIRHVPHHHGQAPQP
jgi:hypothetical protein